MYADADRLFRHRIGVSMVYESSRSNIETRLFDYEKEQFVEEREPNNSFKLLPLSVTVRLITGTVRRFWIETAQGVPSCKYFIIFLKRGVFDGRKVSNPHGEWTDA
jgi:hypothetical protein